MTNYEDDDDSDGDVGLRCNKKGVRRGRRAAAGGEYTYLLEAREGIPRVLELVASFSDVSILLGQVVMLVGWDTPP